MSKGGVNESVIGSSDLIVERFMQLAQEYWEIAGHEYISGVMESNPASGICASGSREAHQSSAGLESVTEYEQAKSLRLGPGVSDERLRKMLSGPRWVVEGGYLWLDGANDHSRPGRQACFWESVAGGQTGPVAVTDDSIFATSGYLDAVRFRAAVEWMLEKAGLPYLRTRALGIEVLHLGGWS